MRVAILESIVMPAGHEVEFDRIIVDELKNQGHEPVFFVPENFPFKLNYQAEVVYLDGGEPVSYAGANALQKIWRSIQREVRRKKWFDSAYDLIQQQACDHLIIPTATYRFVRSLLKTKLVNSTVPVTIIFHGINPKEIANFVKYARACEAYANIRLKVITLRDDLSKYQLSNVELVLPPVFTPRDIAVKPRFEVHDPLRLGFFGQYRREKNVEFFLDAFVKANFETPVELIVQGATARTEDKQDFERIIEKYKNYSNIKFWHKNLIGKEWQQALLDVDVILMPYAAERYLYHWGAMLFTAIGYYKPVLQSPELNPEVLERFEIGEAIKLGSVAEFSKQLEEFINGFSEKSAIYEKELKRANREYGQDVFIRFIIK